ncbi:MAG: tetratricopeptide repeat protein [Sedimentisphaerales bacterium]|nr:tetratricopeptide repeat protein [Sedimentisphaerales bacterium]
MKTITKKSGYLRQVIIMSIICLVGLCGCKESAQKRKMPKNKPLGPDYSNVKFEQAKDPAPTVKTLYVMAGILQNQGQYAKSEAVMKSIIHQYPKSLPAYNHLAQMQLQQGRKKEAIETMQKGLAIYPDDTTLINNIGICWLICNEYEKALEMFTKAADIVPQSKRYRANAALTLSLMERYDESLALFEQILPKKDAIYNVNAIRKNKMIGPPRLRGMEAG